MTCPSLLAGAGEAEFQQWVVSNAEARGWVAAHCRKVKVKRGEREWWETTMPPGWPDLTLVRRGLLCFLELKVPPNTLTPDQEKWAALLRAVGGDTWHFVWTPDQADDILWFLANARKGMSL